MSILGCDFCGLKEGQMVRVAGGGKVVVRTFIVDGDRMCVWCRRKAQLHLWENVKNWKENTK